MRARVLALVFGVMTAAGCGAAEATDAQGSRTSGASADCVTADSTRAECSSSFDAEVGHTHTPARGMGLLSFALGATPDGASADDRLMVTLETRGCEKEPHPLPKYPYTTGRCYAIDAVVPLDGKGEATVDGIPAGGYRLKVRHERVTGQAVAYGEADITVLPDLVSQANVTLRKDVKGTGGVAVGVNWD